MSIIQKFKSIKVLRLILVAVVLIFTGKLLDHFHFPNAALSLQLIAFFLFLYSIISAIESRGKKN
jgi:uncharacterized membrane protein AbrB (regulator of aidB expression)